MASDRQAALSGTLAVVVAACLFGTLGPLSRLAYAEGITPIGFVAWRAALGALLVAAFVAIGTTRGRPLVDFRTIPRRARVALLGAIVSGIVLNLALFIAFGRISVALALLGFYTYPAFVTIAISVRERRPPDAVQLLALMLALAGMTAVVLGQLDPSSGLTFDLLGFGLALLAAASQTVFLIMSRHGYASVPTDQASLALLAGGAAGFLLVAAVAGELSAIIEPATTPAAWPYLLLGGFIGAGIPTTLYLLGVRRIGGVRTSILALLEPVTGTALAALILGETLAPIQVVGAALVLAAGALLQRSPVRRVGGEGPNAGQAKAVPEAEGEPIPLL